MPIIAFASVDYQSENNALTDHLERLYHNFPCHLVGAKASLKRKRLAFPKPSLAEAKVGCCS
jgi:hypothetical protein